MPSRERAGARLLVLDKKKLSTGLKTQSKLESLLSWQLKCTFPRLVWHKEYRFHAERKWRFDFANTELMIALECEGGAGTGGRHTSFKGFRGDLEKYNAAVVGGWRLLRFTMQEIKSGEAIATIGALIEAVCLSTTSTSTKAPTGGERIGSTG